MESNEHTELTRKMETDSQMESRWQLVGGGGEGLEGLNRKKRTQGHGQQCGDCRREGVIRELSHNGKNIMNNLKNKHLILVKKENKRNHTWKTAFYENMCDYNNSLYRCLLYKIHLFGK